MVPMRKGKTMTTNKPRVTTIICVAAYLTFTASLAAGQTSNEQPTVLPEAAWPERLHQADTPLCEWENVGTDPGIARECLKTADVNTGLGAYAFPHTPAEGETPGGSGAYGEVDYPIRANCACLRAYPQPHADGDSRFFGGRR